MFLFDHKRGLLPPLKTELWIITNSSQHNDQNTLSLLCLRKQVSRYNQTKSSLQLWCILMLASSREQLEAFPQFNLPLICHESVQH
jgi:hypothetical protein